MESEKKKLKKIKKNPPSPSACLFASVVLFVSIICWLAHCVDYFCIVDSACWFFFLNRKKKRASLITVFCERTSFWFFCLFVRFHSFFCSFQGSLTFNFNGLKLEIDANKISLFQILFFFCVYSWIYIYIFPYYFTNQVHMMLNFSRQQVSGWRLYRLKTYI